MLIWFDANSALYWSIAWSSFALLAIVALAPALAGIHSEKLEKASLCLLPPWLFIGVLTMSLVAFRWPLWFVGHELNVDESNMLAEAITLLHDPVFWRSVDGSTHGPLNIYPLWMARIVGLNLDYVGARVIGAAMIWMVIFSCYRALQVAASEHLARVAVLPVFCFFAFTTFGDFVHYSSEHTPLMLVTVAFWLLVSELAQSASRRVLSPRWIMAGLLLGGVPMAKLQGLPIAAALFVSAIVFDFLLPGLGSRDRVRRLLLLAATAATPTLVFAIISWIFGIWHHAWISYISQNLQYAGSRHFTHLEMVKTFWSYAGKCENLVPFLTGAIAVCAIACFPAMLARPAALRFAGFAFVLLFSSLVAALAPGRQFFHYLLFIVPPIGLMAGSIWQAAWTTASQLPRARTVRIFLLVLWGGAVLYPQISARVSLPHRYVGSLTTYEPLATEPVAAEILRHSRPGEPLGLWGWNCRYYVYTQMRQATRDAHTVQQIIASPLTEYFRARYLRDLMRSRPQVFIDTVGTNDPSFKNRETQAHETFAALRVYIDENYELIKDLNGSRIYVRLDRLSQH